MGYSIKADYTLTFALPPRLDEWVGPDHSARYLCDVVDALDLKALGFEAREVERGRPPFAADVLVKAWLFGFFERIRSTRRLEWACANVIPALWITGNTRPDHQTLSRFFRKNTKALRALYRKVVRLAAAQGLVGMVLHALDGTKIQAASSTATARHRKTLEKALRECDARIGAHITQVQHDEPIPGEPGAPLPETLADAEQRRDAIRAQLAQLGDSEHLHPKEPDANCVQVQGKYVMGYNAQAIADQESGLIVQTEVVPDHNDTQQLMAQTQAARETLGESPEVTDVDAGYIDGAQLQQAEEAGLNVVVPTPPTAPSTNPGTLGKEAEEFDKSRFRFDETRDGYVCPREQLIPFARLALGKHGVGVQTRVYRCPHAECPVRAQCSKSPEGRTIDRQPWDATMERHRARYADADVAAARRARKTIIEPVFAQVKWNQGFRRFTVRGKEKVNAQWALLCTAFNLKKLYAGWRAGTFTLKVAVAVAG